eukprot:5716322-Amphidinium_carterae.1
MLKPPLDTHGHTGVEHLHKILWAHLWQHVMTVQESMTLGGRRVWTEVEVDECAFAKHRASKGDAVEWLQYIGLMERGRSETLLLIQFPVRKTRPRSPGPGPLRKTDWKPIAQRYLEGRHIILHSDSAKAYDMPFEDVVKDRVVHQPRR